jgi:hypothetical protein
LRDLPRGPGYAADVPTGAAEWYRFAVGYKEAADSLARSVGENAWRRNMLGPPVMFLYRHYVELHLKNLLSEAGQLLDDPQSIPPEHYLLSLWSRVRALLLSIGPNNEDVWFKRADQIIGEFDALDPTSFAFRYPVGRKGADSLPAPLLVDAENVRAVVDELHLLLDGASAQIGEYMSYKYEMH